MFLSIFATLVYMCFNANDTIPYIKADLNLTYKCYSGKYEYVKDDFEFSNYINTEHDLAISNIVFSGICLFLNIIFFISLGNKRTSIAVLVLFGLVHVISVVLFFVKRNFPVINKCDYFCTSVKTCYGGICSRTKDGNYCENELILKRQIPIICSFLFSLVLNIFAFSESQIPEIDLPDRSLLEAKNKSEPILIESIQNDNFSITLDPIDQNPLDVI